MAEGDPGTAQTAARRVLVVDDDALNRRVAAELCARLGLVVETAADGPAALAMLAARPFDLVLLDDRLPGMGGPAVAVELRRREAAGALPRLPVVGVTASVLPEDLDRLLGSGMDACLAKPLLPGELRAVVERLVPTREAPRSGLTPPSGQSRSG